MYKDRLARKKFYNSSDWKEARAGVLERDNYECQFCKEQGKVTTRADEVLEVDHIKELEYYPKSATDIENLRTLCRPCHNERHDRLGRKEVKEDLNLKFAETW